MWQLYAEKWTCIPDECHLLLSIRNASRIPYRSHATLNRSKDSVSLSLQHCKQSLLTEATGIQFPQWPNSWDFFSFLVAYMLKWRQKAVYKRLVWKYFKSSLVWKLQTEFLARPVLRPKQINGNVRKLSEDKCSQTKLHLLFSIIYDSKIDFERPKYIFSSTCNYTWSYVLLSYGVLCVQQTLSCLLQ